MLGPELPWPGRGRGGHLVGDPAQLLDIKVDQLPGPLPLVADDDAAGAVGVRKPAHAMAGQHPIDGRASHGQVVAEPMGPWRRRRRAASTRRTWVAGRVWGGGGGWGWGGGGGARGWGGGAGGGAAGWPLRRE